MDTVIEIICYGGKNVFPAIEAAFYEFERIQGLCDRFNSGSQVSKINQMAGEAPVVVDGEVVELIRHAGFLSAVTDGAFDITVGAFTDLWGIGHKDRFLPSQTEIDAALPLVAHRHIVVKENTVFLPERGMKLDLGGVAKGHAINKAIDALRRQGIRSALLNAGGDIRVIGRKPGDVPWRIGVQHPRKRDALIAKLSLVEWDTVETSGDYRRCYIRDGQRFAHIFNPRTGRQPEELASVTLIYRDGYPASNIASCGVLTMGLAAGLQAVQRLPGLEALFVTASGEVVITRGLENKIQLAPFT